MSTWAEIAAWAEWRADQLRVDADRAERFVGTDPCRAFATALRRSADTMTAEALVWRQLATATAVIEEHDHDREGAGRFATGPKPGSSG